MSIESGWVPWNERNFLPERFALIRIYPCKDGYYERDVTIGNFIFFHAHDNSSSLESVVVMVTDILFASVAFTLIE